MKKSVLTLASISVFVAAFALPGQAFAGCGQANGSFIVSCESGVKVYRHHAPSSHPSYVTPQYSAAERRADVALQLEARRVAIEERRQRAEETDLIRTRRGYNRQFRSRRYVAFGDARGGRLIRSRGIH